MAASDLLITKGGALTISEALTVGLPMVIYKPIPGHENGNASFVEKAGAGIKVNSLPELKGAVSGLIHDQQKMKDMSAAAKNLVPENTAKTPASTILKITKDRK